MIRTIAAAVGAMLVILALATMASKLTHRTDAVAQESALRR
jgi:hypothetical protein